VDEASRTLPPRAPVVSGMRPTGALHLGHYHGVLRNWVSLSHTHECLYFVADWHALTTRLDRPEELAQHTREMVIDWIAVGLDPARVTLFVQSRVPAHAELHLLLSMVVPVGWLERVPTYKELRQAASGEETLSYGFLGYPVLMSADVLLYGAAGVPVGEDQLAHLELTREIARRFNDLYGRGPSFAADLERALGRLGPEERARYDGLLKAYRERGEEDARARLDGFLASLPALGEEERDLLAAAARGTGRAILREPRPLLTETPRLPGLDGRKMSKSYGNTITLRDEPPVVWDKLRTMTTDPARVRRSDPGDPEKCPVWAWHLVYSDGPTRAWVDHGCRTAGIGCLDCKKKLLEPILRDLEPIRTRAQELASRPDDVDAILEDGSRRARAWAEPVLETVRSCLGLPRRGRG
jgi:tryptophanyl-tRNA synthetase